MNKLIKHKFNTLYEMSSGISTKPAQAGHGAPFVSFSTVFNNYFLPQQIGDSMNTSLKEQEVYSIKKGDILLTRTSETVNELGMSCVALRDYPGATYSGFLKRLRPLQKDITYDKYMAFYLRSDFFRKVMTNNAVLTLRASLNEDIFSYLDLHLPEYKIQKKIGDFLFLLNSKIETNNKISSEFDSYLKKIYEYWFVQFDFPNKAGKPYKSSGGKMVFNDILNREIPQGWIVEQLGDVITRSGTGLNPRNHFVLGKGNNFYITIKNIKDGKIIFDNSCDRIDDESLQIINNRSDLQPGDILFTSIEPVGITYLIHETPKNWNINESVFTLRPNFRKVSPEYLFMLLSSIEMKTFTKNVSAGSIHKGIRHGVLKTFKLPYGGMDIINEFTRHVSPFLKKKYLLEQENRELLELRNSLLPMFINGQITLK